MPSRFTFYMHILQLDLKDKRQVDDFLGLPFSIYRDMENFGIDFYKAHRTYYKDLVK